MKRFLIGALMILALSSCGKDSEDPFTRFLAQPSYSPKSGWIFDFSPTLVRILLSDAQGNDLMDPENENGWLNKPISASFNGKTYEGIEMKGIRLDDEQTKAYLAVIKGFYIYPKEYTETEQYVLTFGELDSADLWNHDLVISWPDGSSDVIRVQHALRWNVKGEPEMYTGFKFNGEPVDGAYIRIQK